MSQSNNPTELSWYEASYQYHMMVALMENIKSIAGASLTTNRIRRNNPLAERDRFPGLKTINELTPDEILQRLDYMKKDLIKMYEFIKQIIEKQ